MRTPTAGYLSAAAVAALALTGCGPTQAGSAAIVGEDRISDAEVQAEVALVEEQAADFGVELAGEDRTQVAAAVVSDWVFLRLVDGVADEDSLDFSQDALDTQVDELGGPEALVAGGVDESRIDDQAKLEILVGSLLTPTAEERLEEEIREDLREQLREEGEQMDLTDPELGEQVELILEQQQGEIVAQVPQRALDERLAEYTAETDVEVSSRYGAYDEEFRSVVPGTSPLSAPGLDLDAPPPALGDELEMLQEG